MQKITPFLTFEKDAKKAVEFYVGIFKNSHINTSMTVPGSETLLHASFVLDGQEFMAMDGGPTFKFEQGTSLFVSCKDQAEVDYYWEKLGQGGEYQPCGWLKDQFGISWQIIPDRLGELMQDPDQAKAGRVMQAMLKMGKIEIDKLEAAAHNE